MKIIKFLICFSFILFSAQSNAQDKNDLDSMINGSILEYVKIINDYIKNDPRSGKINDYSGVYVLSENFPDSFELTSEVKALGFKSIPSLYEYRKMFKRSRSVLRFVGPIIYKNRITIRIIRTSVKSKWKISNLIGKTHFNILAGGATVCTWEYSQEAEKWILINTKDFGV